MTGYAGNVRSIADSEGLYLKGDNIGGDTGEFLVNSGSSQNFVRNTARVGYRYNGSQVVDTSYVQVAAGESSTGYSNYLTFVEIIKKLNPGDLITFDFDNMSPEPSINGKTYAFESYFEYSDGAISSHFLNMKFTNMFVTPDVIDSGNLISFTGNNVEAAGQKLYGPFETPLPSKAVYVDVSAPGV